MSNFFHKNDVDLSQICLVAPHFQTLKTLPSRQLCMTLDLIFGLIDSLTWTEVGNNAPFGEKGNILVGLEQSVTSIINLNTRLVLYAVTLFS